MEVVLSDVGEINSIRLFEYNLEELLKEFRNRHYNFFVDSLEQKVFLDYNSLKPQLVEVFGDIVRNVYIVLSFSEVRFFDHDQYNVTTARNHNTINDTSTIISNYRIMIDFTSEHKVIFSNEGFYARKLNNGSGYY